MKPPVMEAWSMCATCGCQDADGARVQRLDAHEHSHPHEHRHPRGHDGHDRGDAHRTVTLEQDILAKNDALARRNRAWLTERGVVTVNLMSSPGAGKTTLLERTARELGHRLPIYVVEGDQETTLDAERVRAAGCAVVQINTGAGCHLDAEMLQRGVRELDPAASSLLFVENVGNLVCPALFELGEHGRVVVISVTEGDDKPLKYPNMFRGADLVVVNKVDLLPYVDFDVDRCTDYAGQVNPGVRVLRTSATRGDGMEEWYAWLREPLASLTSA